MLAELTADRIHLLHEINESERLVRWARAKNLDISQLRGAMQVRNGGTAFEIGLLEAFTEVFNGLASLFRSGSSEPADSLQLDGASEQDPLFLSLYNINWSQARQLGSKLQALREHTGWLEKLVESESVSPTVRAVEAVQSILDKGVFSIGYHILDIGWQYSRQGLRYDLSGVRVPAQENLSSKLVCRVVSSQESEAGVEETVDYSSDELSEFAAQLMLTATAKHRLQGFLSLEKELCKLSGVVETLQTTSGVPEFSGLSVLLTKQRLSVGIILQETGTFESLPISADLIGEDKDESTTTVTQLDAVKAATEWLQRLHDLWLKFVWVVRKQAPSLNRFTRRELLYLGMFLKQAEDEEKSSNNINARPHLARLLDTSVGIIDTAVAKVRNEAVSADHSGMLTTMAEREQRLWTASKTKIFMAQGFSAEDREGVDHWWESFYFGGEGPSPHRRPPRRWGIIGGGPPRRWGISGGPPRRWGIIGGPPRRWGVLLAGGGPPRRWGSSAQVGVLRAGD